MIDTHWLDLMGFPTVSPAAGRNLRRLYVDYPQVAPLQWRNTGSWLFVVLNHWCRYEEDCGD